METTFLGRVRINQVNRGDARARYRSGTGRYAEARLVELDFRGRSTRRGSDATRAPLEAGVRPLRLYLLRPTAGSDDGSNCGSTLRLRRPPRSRRRCPSLGWCRVEASHDRRAARSVEHAELREKEEDTAWWWRRRGACRWQRRGADEGEEVEGEIKTVGATPDMWSHCHVIQNLRQYQ
jgi:hypothetical protein